MKVPVAYRCPHCAHGFVRLSGKIEGSTSCPKCLKRFTRVKGQVLEDEATSVRREAIERRYQRNKAIYSPPANHGNLATIRGDQVPLSAAEAKFKARAVEKGWRPHRPSWPDFLVETETGLIAVEVKARTDNLNVTQIETFSVLEAAGIPVYLWKDRKDTKSTLIRWSKGKALERVVHIRPRKHRSAKGGNDA